MRGSLCNFFGLRGSLGGFTFASAQVGMLGGAHVLMSGQMDIRVVALSACQNKGPPYLGKAYLTSKAGCAALGKAYLTKGAAKVSSARLT